MQDKVNPSKSSLYKTADVCGGVCICTDPSLYLYFPILLCLRCFCTERYTYLHIEAEQTEVCFSCFHTKCGIVQEVWASLFVPLDAITVKHSENMFFFHCLVLMPLPHVMHSLPALSLSQSIKRRG